VRDLIPSAHIRSERHRSRFGMSFASRVSDIPRALCVSKLVRDVFGWSAWDGRHHSTKERTFGALGCLYCTHHGVDGILPVLLPRCVHNVVQLLQVPREDDATEPNVIAPHSRAAILMRLRGNSGTRVVVVVATFIVVIKLTRVRVFV
jgi:hypothetical protein